MNDQFRDMIRANNWVVLDTETTGLNYGSEVCQIAIVDYLGGVLLDTLVKPTKPIPSDATRIHGITNGMVVKAPHWKEVAELVRVLLLDKDLIIYNADYDLKIIDCSCELAEVQDNPAIDVKDVHCAMLAYAEYYGDWNEYRNSWRRQSLTKACAQQNVTVDNAHNALGDCIMTRNLIMKVIGDMAKRELAGDQS